MTSRASSASAAAKCYEALRHGDPGKELESKAKFIAQVMTGDMTIRRVEDLDSAALTYAEVKAIASGNPLVIEKAQVDAKLMRLTRLRSAHAYR